MGYFEGNVFAKESVWVGSPADHAIPISASDCVSEVFSL
jgi:hypothetical protein